MSDNASSTAVRTERTVRRVMGGSYYGWGVPKKEQEESLVSHLVEALESSDSSAEAGESSEAANKVRQMLMRRENDETVSATTTCNMFSALGRSSELGSTVKAEAGDYDSDSYTEFARRLVVIELMNEGEM